MTLPVRTVTEITVVKKVISGISGNGESYSDGSDSDTGEVKYGDSGNRNSGGIASYVSGNDDSDSDDSGNDDSCNDESVSDDSRSMDSLTGDDSDNNSIVNNDRERTFSKNRPLDDSFIESRCPCIYILSP